MDNRMKYEDFKKEVDIAMKKQGVREDIPLTATELNANNAIHACRNSPRCNPGMHCKFCPEKMNGSNCPPADRWYTIERKAQKLKKKQSYLDNRVKVKLNDEGEIMTDGIVGRIVENGSEACGMTKSALIDAQIGSAVLTAVKQALVKLPLPEQVKAVLDMPGYGDLAVGLVLNTVVATVSDNRKMIAAAQHANMVGAYRASDQITLIQDVISGALAAVTGATEGIMNAVSTQVPTEDGDDVKDSEG